MGIILKSVLDTILPPRCLLCGKILSGENGLCEDCFSKINFISAPICQKCGHPLPTDSAATYCANCTGENQLPFEMIRSRVKYDESSKPLIINFKFHDKTEYGLFLAHWLYSAGRDIWQNSPDILMPVPLHPKRLLYRRYNQAAILCRELGKIANIPVDYDALIRQVHTRPQVEFSGHERVKNIKGAFYVRKPERVKGRRIVLIDDVFTTGSTLKECALCLLQNGAAAVDALTVARVLKV